MGYKKVCIDCRKAFNRPADLEKAHISICPQCEKPMTELYHLFQPPKQTDIKKWNVVKFLYKMDLDITTLERMNQLTKELEKLRNIKTMQNIQSL